MKAVIVVHYKFINRNFFPSIHPLAPVATVASEWKFPSLLSWECLWSAPVYTSSMSGTAEGETDDQAVFFFYLRINSGKQTR